MSDSAVRGIPIDSHAGEGGGNSYHCLCLSKPTSDAFSLMASKRTSPHSRRSQPLFRKQSLAMLQSHSAGQTNPSAVGWETETLTAEWGPMRGKQGFSGSSKTDQIETTTFHRPLWIALNQTSNQVRSPLVLGDIAENRENRRIFSCALLDVLDFGKFNFLKTAVDRASHPRYRQRSFSARLTASATIAVYLTVEMGDLGPHRGGLPMFVFHALFVCVSVKPKRKRHTRIALHGLS